ncbi:MAG: DUF2202 domain-containing protein [Sulfurimonas sp.]|jgi:hypothetical protein
MKISKVLPLFISFIAVNVVLVGCNSAGNNGTSNSTAQSTSTLSTIVTEALSSANSDLTQELKNTLSYMGNEERLAYDVYNKLYEKYPLTQLKNIATNGESQHIEAVQLLVQKYIANYSEFSNIDMVELGYKDTNLTQMNAGTYDISAIQNLYNALIAKGEQSSQDALEVGCMVEVTDINDLDGDITLANQSNATDISAVFSFLRDGSYSHYWAFDSGLKNMGVTEGCCSLGIINGVDYCHSEYPQSRGRQ